MKYILTIVAMACLASLKTLCAEPVPEYSVDSIAGIVSELNKIEYEKPVKEWLKVNRPAQYEKMFAEKPKEQNADAGKPESKGLFSALGELSAAIADSQTFLIDYYINSKAKHGWRVVSLTDQMILFRRDPKEEGEAGTGQPATRPESKSESGDNP